MQLRKIAAVLVLSSGAISMKASAATYVITYTGLVDSIYDMTGMFGAIPQPQGLIPYTSVYTLKYPTPGVNVTSPVPNSLEYAGGTQLGLPSPVSGTLTINGITQSFAGSYIGLAFQGDSNFPDTIAHRVEDKGTIQGIAFDNYIQNSIFDYAGNMVSSADFTAALNYTLQGNNITGGDFQFYSTDAQGNELIKTFGNLHPIQITIAAVPVQPPAVPEPASWALMLAGFGMCGAAMRYRSSSVRASIA